MSVRGSDDLSPPAYSVVCMQVAAFTPPRSGVTKACDVMSLGVKLRAPRRSAGLTRSTLARRQGTTQSASARLEAGRQYLILVVPRRAAVELGHMGTVLISELRPV